MKVAFVKRKGKVSLRTLPVPEPQKGEVVIRVDACGICGSDFIEASHWAKNWKRFGHEVAGTIQACGEGVAGLSSGNKVVMALSMPCGECEACHKGLPRYCSQLIVAEQGGFAEHLLVKDSRLLRRISSSVPSRIACLAEPLTVILEAFKLARLGESDVVFVTGGGFLGTLAVLAAHLIGVPVAGVMSRRLNDNIRRVLELTGGEFVKWPGIARKAITRSSAMKALLASHVGRSVILNTAPPRMMATYLDALPYAATVVNIGLSGAGKENRLKIDAAQNIFRHTQLLSAFPVPCLYLKDAVSLLERHAEAFSVIETQIVSLEELPLIIATHPRGAKKIVSMEQ